MRVQNLMHQAAATVVIGSSNLSHTQLTRGALQQSGTKAGFQISHHSADTGLGHPKGFTGCREAPFIHNPDKHR